MDFATRRTYYNRCKSLESLAPGDERNLDIDGFGRHRVRGTNWTERLGNAIELSDQPVFLLFTGLPGSGKSTELRRLAARLRDPQRGNFLPVLVDGETYLDLTGRVDVSDIIAAILFAAEEAVLAADQYYTVLNDDHRQIADQMLLNNAVLRYVNDNDWFDLHPAVAEIPGVRAARAALAAAPPS